MPRMPALLDRGDSVDGPPLRAAPAEAGAILLRLAAIIFPPASLPRQAKIHPFRHVRGPIIFSGRTMASNSSAVTKPMPTASSRSVVPFLWAALAIFVALS